MFQTGKPGPCALRREGRCAHSLLVKNGVFGVAVAVFVIVAAFGPANSSIAQCKYEIAWPLIQGPNCQFTGHQPTFVNGLNAKGWVVGSYLDCLDATIHHAFVWKPGEGTAALPTPSGVQSSRANDINDNGFIVGEHWYPLEGWKAFVFDPVAQQYHYLEALHPGIGTVVTVSSANAINNSNIVAGSRIISPPGKTPLVSNAVVWYPQGFDGDGREIVIDLGTLGVGPNSSARALNDTGASVVGWTGTGGDVAIPFRLDQDGTVTLLDATYGLDLGFANGVNNSDTIVGSANFSGGPSRGFIWSGSKVLLIDPLPGYTAAGASSLNNLEQILGRSTAGLANQTPTLWQHGKLADLSKLILQPPDVNLFFQNTHAINDNGQILLRSAMGAKTVGVLVTPIDRPLSDLNADCITDVHDLIMLLHQWGPCANCGADFTDSGAVGVPDLLILLANWG